MPEINLTEAVKRGRGRGRLRSVSRSRTVAVPSSPEAVKRGRGQRRSISRSRTVAVPSSPEVKKGRGRPRSTSRNRTAANNSQQNGISSSTLLRRRMSRSPVRQDISPATRSFSLLVKKLDMGALADNVKSTSERSVSPARTGVKREREPTKRRQSARIASQKALQVSDTESETSPRRQASSSRKKIDDSSNFTDFTQFKARFAMKEEPTTTTPVAREFGGAIGVFIMGVSFPLMILYFHLLCQQHDCSVYHLPDIPSTLEAYVTGESALIVLGYFLTLCFLALLPIGPNVNFLGRYVRMAGMLSLVVQIVVLAVLKYVFGFTALSVTKQYFLFITPAYALAMCLAVILYWIGKNPANVRNPTGQTGNFVYDFFMGRSINPYLGPLNIKCLLVRILILGVAAFNMVFVYTDYEVNGTFSPTLMLLATWLSFYLLDSLWFEESMLTTFEMMREGVGYMMATGYFLYPFLPTIMTFFVMKTRTELPWYFLVPISIQFVMGFYIYRASNSQKSAFRSNPNDPALAGLETIPTLSGRKLLVSGWWGWVRHPNYFGDLLMHWSFAFLTGTAGLNFTVCLVLPVMTTGLLLHRAYRNEVRCRYLYGPAWERYCQRVKSQVFKGVY